MGLFLLIGLFCLLAVIGFFATGRPFKFAFGGIVLLIATVFVLLIIIVIWTMAAPCSAPFTDHSSAYCRNQTSTLTSNPAQIVPTSQVTTAVPSTGVLPTVVGQCDGTTITQIGTRLTDGSTGNPIPGTGSAIWYADGGYQVSYDTVQGIADSQIGDHVNLCLVSIPTNCPIGDNRGRVYQATNLRTGENWEASDAEHSCGGA